jgi:hypothetical protein
MFRSLTSSPSRYRAAFRTDGPKYVARAVNGVVPKFNVNVRWTLEDSLIHLVRLIRAAPNSSEWVVNRDFIGMSEIFVNHLQIASIERAVELGQCLLRLAQVSEVLVTCDRVLYRFHALSVGCTNGIDNNAIWAAKPSIAAVLRLLRDSTTDMVPPLLSIVGDPLHSGSGTTHPLY